jgi:hypothetical protein
MQVPKQLVNTKNAHKNASYGIQGPEALHRTEADSGPKRRAGAESGRRSCAGVEAESGRRHCAGWSPGGVAAQGSAPLSRRAGVQAELRRVGIWTAGAQV